MGVGRLCLGADVRALPRDPPLHLSPTRGKRVASGRRSALLPRIANYLSFKVESPASASTTETIQKRMTICGSVQPSCSK